MANMFPMYGCVQLRSVVDCLAILKHLRKLNLFLRGEESPGVSIAMLLQALKRNSSLWQVTANLMEDWSEAETDKKKFYAKRNQLIHAILEAPKTSVQLLSAWP